MYVGKPSDEPYDQFKVTERAPHVDCIANLPVAKIRELALAAMEKVLARDGENAVLPRTAKA